MQTGKVVSVSRSGAAATVVIRGLDGIVGGRRLRCGKQVWIVVRRVWQSGDRLCLILQAVSGGMPQIGDKVSLMGSGAEPEPVTDPEPDSLKVEINLEPIPQDQVCRIPSVTSEEVLKVTLDKLPAREKPIRKRKAKKSPPKPRRSSADQSLGSALRGPR